LIHVLFASDNVTLAEVGDNSLPAARKILAPRSWSIDGARRDNEWCFFGKKGEGVRVALI
jgi:hypothetical protein